MKKLIHKINSWLYEYHRAKMFKYFYKMIGARRYYIKWDNRQNIKCTLNSLYGNSVYADTDSIKENIK